MQSVHVKKEHSSLLSSDCEGCLYSFDATKTAMRIYYKEKNDKCGVCDVFKKIQMFKTKKNWSFQ